MTVYFHTLGCKVNQYETQAMRALLEERGYSTAEFAAGFSGAGDGVMVINSCTVTGESDRKLRQLLRRCRRDNPAAVIALVGCMPQAFPDRAADLPADILLGTARRRDLPDKIEAFLAARQKIVDIPPTPARYEPLSIREFQGRTRAFVKIQDGCNRFCSYCAIPYARGRVRSRDLADLKREVETLAAAGYREVVLTGINLTSFGQDTGFTLADAAAAACGVPGICRVRLGSLEPDHMTPELIAALAKQEKLCPHFHVALQSGCDATLRRMRRHYTAAAFAALCADLRAAFPGCALTTDVMVGFPGEDEGEFEASRSFVEQIGFADAHVFAYSRRPGTPAAAAPDQVPAALKADRAKRMADTCAGGRASYRRGLVGSLTTVLLEAPQPDGTMEGHTPTYIPVHVKTDKPSGSLIRVRLTGDAGEWCTGEETE